MSNHHSCLIKQILISYPELIALLYNLTIVMYDTFPHQPNYLQDNPVTLASDLPVLFLLLMILQRCGSSGPNILPESCH